MITKLQVENFKRIVAVSIEPEGGLVRVTGKNGAGKSSVLDSIFSALCGERAVPKEALRRGAKKGLVEVTLDEPPVMIRRTFTEEGTSLIIQSRDGAVFKSPQRMLDELFGKASFDPLAFMARRPAEQVEVLLDVVDLKADPARLEQLAPGSTIENPIERLAVRYSGLYDDRTLERRVATQIAGELAAFPPPGKDDPTASRPVPNLIVKRDELKAVWRQQEKEVEVRDAAEARIGKIDDEIAYLEGQISALKGERGTCCDALSRFDKLTFRDVEAEISEIDEQIESAEGVNERYNQILRRKEVEARHTKQAAAVEDLTAQLEAIKLYKEELVAGAKMPIPGLGFTEGAVTYNGIVLEQASQAEQLRVSVAIAMALAPAARVMLIREGSLLDDDGVKLLAQLAAETKTQVWMEAVDSSGRVGIVIEDGAVKAVNHEAASEAEAASTP